MTPSERQKAWREANPERYRAYQREYQRKRAQAKREAKNAHKVANRLPQREWTVPPEGYDPVLEDLKLL